MAETTEVKELSSYEFDRVRDEAQKECEYDNVLELVNKAHMAVENDPIRTTEGAQALAYISRLHDVLNGVD